MSKKIVKIAMSIPNEGHTLPEAYDNRLEMCFHLGVLQTLSSIGIHEYKGVTYSYPDDREFEFYWSTVGRVLTPLARERLTQWALKENMDYIFFIDDDMICPMDLFEKLYLHNVDIVAPLAFMRTIPHYPVMFRFIEGYDKLANQDYYIAKLVKNYPKNKLVECDAVGFGAALIKIDVIRRMSKPWFMSTTESGEDVWFCRQARQAGAKVFMDTSIKLGHLGIPPVIEEKDYEREFEIKEFRDVHGEYKRRQDENS